MHYVSAIGLSKSFGIQPLFEGIDFHIEEGDKIALVARNGMGKSTLLRILAGRETADEGKCWIHKDVTVALFEQEPQLIGEATVLDNIFHHDHPLITAIKTYEAACDSGDTRKVNEAVIRMDELGAWDFDSRVKQILGKLNIHQFGQTIATLSGGQQKRVALARTLIDIGFENRHVLLLMDEPTNHLDVDMVEWLERYLDQEKLTLMLVTHDRYFLDAVCGEIWELDRSRIYSYKGDYENFLDKKAAREESESASIDKARNLYRKELEWIRKQPRARTTKSRSRLDAFRTIERKANQQLSDPQLELQMKMNRLGGKVVELKKVYKQFNGKHILKGFDYSFKKGERIGIIGANGVGKSTFVRLLQGLEAADSGKIIIGETVIFGNYDQRGLEVREDMRVIDYAKSIAESFPLASGGSLSAAQFLQLFLFDPDKQYTYISRLSGGEKRRLHLLTILFRNPNFLVLDEPTNDLDLPTLAVLENFLLEFSGCLVIISHDRYFMDRLIDHLFVFEGEAVVSDFPGNYSQYRQWKHARQKENQAVREPPAGSQHAPAPREKRKIGYKEKREFEMLEKEISDLNTEKKSITARLDQGGLPYETLEQLSVRMAELGQLLDEKELRWLELSEYID